MALAALLASELTAQGAPRWKQVMAWLVAGLQAIVILSMRFHYFADVVTGCLAAITATLLAGALGRWIDARFAPWSLRAGEHGRSTVVAPASVAASPGIGTVRPPP